MKNRAEKRSFSVSLFKGLSAKSNTGWWAWDGNPHNEYTLFVTSNSEPLTSRTGALRQSYSHRQILTLLRANGIVRAQLGHSSNSKHWCNGQVVIATRSQIFRIYLY